MAENCIEEYRIVIAKDYFALRLLIHYENYTECSPDIIVAPTFENLRTEVFKMIEAFGKPVIKKGDIC